MAPPARRSTVAATEKAPSPEKTALDAPLPEMPTHRRRWRLAFPLYVGVVLLPLLGCTALPIAVAFGLPALPAAMVGLGVMALILLGAAAVKFLEERESRAPAP